MLSVQQCKEDPSPAPPRPHTELEKLPFHPKRQKNFGCLVDGKGWFRKEYIGPLAFYQTGSLDIPSGVSNDLFNGIMTMYVFEPNLQEGSYDLTERVFNGNSARSHEL